MTPQSVLIATVLFLAIYFFPKIYRKVEITDKQDLPFVIVLYVFFILVLIIPLMSFTDWGIKY